MGTSPVQWLEIQLPMQRMWVQSLVKELSLQATTKTQHSQINKYPLIAVWD